MPESGPGLRHHPNCPFVRQSRTSSADSLSSSESRCNQCVRHSTSLHHRHRHPRSSMHWSVVLAVSFSLLSLIHSVDSGSTDASGKRFVPPTTRDLDSLVREAVGEIERVFESRMKKFDGFFRELLTSSKRDFHSMFMQTYGLLYERNAFIFTDMFSDLERYYTYGEGIKLDDVMDRFFHRLYSKMFQVLNAQYTFDEVYLKCVSEKMDDLKPFGDIPKKLKIEVRRAFVATRTFVWALTQVTDLLRRASDVQPSSDCSSQLSVFTSCTSCLQGSDQVGSTKYCPSLCPATMSKCLAPFNQVNEEWNKFVQSLLLLVSRLETSFNIESVVDPIDIKISEAIMNFQENGIQVSNKLFEQCGKPRIGKRSPPRMSTQRDDPRFGGSVAASSRSRSGGVIDAVKYHNNRDSGQSIDTILTDIKRKVKKTKDWWLSMPTLICSHKRTFESLNYPIDVTVRSADQPANINCWNGSQILTIPTSRWEETWHRYFFEETRATTGQPLTRQTRTDVGRSGQSGSDPTVRMTIVKLKSITKKLNYAYNGLDVEWTPESSYGESDLVTNAHQGSASGDSRRDDDDDDDDDEDDDDDDDDSRGGHHLSPPKLFNPEDEKTGNDLTSFSPSTTPSSPRTSTSKVVTLTATSGGTTSGLSTNANYLTTIKGTALTTLIIFIMLINIKL